MRTHAHLLAASTVLAVVAMLSACGQETDSPPTATDPTTEAPSPTTEPEPTEDAVPTTDEMVAHSVEDLADRLGVDPAEVDVVDVEAVTWSSGAIGCAKPGMSYTEALVEGTRITLAVGGKEYAYHSGQGAMPAWCVSPTE